MVVKKKVARPAVNHGSIELSPHLQKVREAIQNLSTDEGAIMNQAATETADTSKENTAPKSTGPRKKTAAKKPAAAATKKASTKSNDDGGMKLAEICKGLKIEPSKARKVLRTADGVPEAGARWSWTKAADIAKVKKILTDATAA